LRARKLATVAIPRLSTGSSVLFPVAPFFRGPISRSAAVDSTFTGA
jgi:hypothetical protein